MSDQDQLAEEFEQNRARLRAVALNVLGSTSEADDAVQEAWLRLSRTGPDGIDNLGGWLTTVVSRVCLDMLRSRRSRREDGGTGPEAEAPDTTAAGDPEARAVLAATIGPALLMVLDQLSPPERIAFVLHDTFAVPFEEIAPIVGRTPAATRQLASRARRRVRGGITPSADRAREGAVVEAFLAAAHSGDLTGLLALLAPDVVLRADAAAVGIGAPAELVGPDSVAAMFDGRAQAAAVAVIDGSVGLVWAVGGRPQVVFEFTVEDGRVACIDMGADDQLVGAASVEPFAP